nr:hypothetical protein Iba_chr12cCG10710 [Ipomoea batatas]
MNDLHTSSFRHRIPFPSFCGRLLLSETIMETGEPPPKHLETDQQIVYRCLEELRRAGFSIPSSAIERIQSGVHTTDFQLTLQTQLPTKMAAASPQPAMTHLSCADIPLAVGEDEGGGVVRHHQIDGDGFVSMDLEVKDSTPISIGLLRFVVGREREREEAASISSSSQTMMILDRFLGILGLGGNIEREKEEGPQASMSFAKITQTLTMFIDGQK